MSSRKAFLVGAVALAVTSLSLAQDIKPPPSNQSLEDKMFSGPNPRLTPRERKGVEIGDRFNGTSFSATDLPAPGADGMVRYIYGTVQASVVCAVLQVCDVELQKGEHVQSMNIGDSARWVVTPALTGEGPSVTEHLIIKPTDVGLDTSVVVTTDRRTYHLRLRSHRTLSMVRVGFSYPEEAQAQWAALERQRNVDRERKTIPATSEYLGDLSFSYRITGDASWKPIRVYNDGAKTILQMPATLQQSEAPILLVVRKDGGLFTSEETAMVNYRVQGDRYIVDKVFEKAVLIAGVGSSQTRVTIEREEKK